MLMLKKIRIFYGLGKTSVTNITFDVYVSVDGNVETCGVVVSRKGCRQKQSINDYDCEMEQQSVPKTA